MQQISKSTKILTVFLQIPEFIEFCIPELKSLFCPYEIPLKELFKYEIPPESFPEETFRITRHSFQNFPYVYISIPDPVILKEVLARSILIVAFLESLSEGMNYKEIIENIDKAQMEPYIKEKDPFAFFVETHQVKISEPEKVERIKNFEKLDFQGKVDLKNFKNRFWVIENYSNKDDCKPGEVQLLKNIFFGREIVKRPRGGRKFHGIYELTNRIFLGPTTTDNDLAFLMANQGNVAKESWVYDPFVGTGGLLIPCAHFGAMCFGTEIDKRVVQGYRVGRLNKKSPFFKEAKNLRIDVFANFKQYGFPLPEIIVMDVAVSHFRGQALFDAIICDPPYGLRAAIKSSESKPIEETKSPEEAKQRGDEEEIASGKTCEDMVRHLFDLGRVLLKKHGKLVYLYPIVKEKGYTLDDVLKDPDFDLVDYCENYVCSKVSRLCITMIRNTVIYCVFQYSEMINHILAQPASSLPFNHHQTFVNPVAKEMHSKFNFTDSSGHLNAVIESGSKRLKNKRSYSSHCLQKLNDAENSFKDIPQLTTRVFKKANCRSLILLNTQSPCSSPRKLKSINPKIRTLGDIMISSDSLESTDIPANSLSPSTRLYLDLFDHNRERSKSPCFGGGKISSAQDSKKSLQTIDFGAKVANKINQLIKGHYTNQERSEMSLLIAKLKAHGKKSRSPIKSRTSIN